MSSGIREVHALFAQPRASALLRREPRDAGDGALLLCNVNGVFKSTDDGKTFRLVCKSQVE